MKKDGYSTYAGILLNLLIVLHIPQVRQFLSFSFYAYPVIWSCLILVICVRLPGIHVPGRLCFRQYIVGYAFSGAIIFLSSSYLLGVFLGSLNATPYDISPMGIFRNAVSLVPAFSAREMIRAYVLGTISRKKRFPIPKAVMLTLLFAMLELNYGKAAVLDSTAEIFIYGAKDVVPVILKNLLLSLLVYYGGAKSGAVYSLGIGIFQRVFPFLPTIPWLADSALGIAFPVLFSFFIIEKYRTLSGEGKDREKGNIFASGSGLMAAVLFSWFVVGVFPVYPSVVLTGSMEPWIDPGDAILIRKLKEEKEIYQLKQGDVINFKRENITITHRIIEVEKDESGNVLFRTKGDNNQSPDALTVNPNDINGIVTAVIPKAGLPVLLLRSSDPVPEGVVEE